MLTAGLEDGAIVLWDVATGAETRRYEATTSGVRHIAVNPRRPNELVEVDRDATLRYWNIETGRPNQALPATRSDEISIVDIAYRPDGSRLLSFAEDGTLCAWDTAARSKVPVCQHVSEAAGVARFSADSTRLLVVHDSSPITAEVFDTTSAKRERTLEHVPRRLSTYRLEPITTDGSLAAIVAEFADSPIYDLRTGAVLWSIPKGEGEIRAAAFNPSGRTLLTIAETMGEHGVFSTTGRLRDARTGAPIVPPIPLGEFQLQPERVSGIRYAQNAVFSPDGASVLVSTADGEAVMLAMPDGKETRRLTSSYPGAIGALAIDCTSSLLVVGVSGRHDLSTWDLSSGRMSGGFPLGTRAPDADRSEGLGSRANVTSMVPPPPRLGFDATGAHLALELPDALHRWDVATRTETTLWPRLIRAGYLRGMELQGDHALLERETLNESTIGWIHGFEIWSVDTATGQGSPIHVSTSPGYNGAVLRNVVVSSGGTAAIGINDRKVVRLGLGPNHLPSPTCETPAQLKELGVLVVSRDGRYLLSGNDGGTVDLYDAATCRLIRRFSGDTDAVTTIAISDDNQKILSGTASGRARLWRVSGRLIAEFRGHSGGITTSAFFPDGSRAVTGGADGGVRIWRTTDGAELVTLFGTGPNDWIAIAPDGRFDAADVNHLAMFHWTMPDDPYRPMSPDMYMRDFYEPGLLRRVLSGAATPGRPLRSPATLSRALPVLGEITPRLSTKTSAITIDVPIAGGVYTSPADGVTTETGVFDLRVYRNGRLVGERPAPGFTRASKDDIDSWRGSSQVVPPEQQATVTFPDLGLPHDGGDVVFSAYAFNADRVRSAVSTLRIPSVAVQVVRTVHIVAVGVADYGDERWELPHAGDDARNAAAALATGLAGAGYQRDVSLLISDHTRKGRQIVATDEATKDRVRLALQSLAIRSTPDDVAIIYFSGHGYSTLAGDFYLFPSDAAPQNRSWPEPAPEDLRVFISADELALWLHDLDAAEIVLILDACDSGASIDRPGFRPGPLGDRGLGQLAYDKRMRVLAASQSNQAALEIEGAIHGGALTYALFEGVATGKAARSDGTMTLKDVLSYPVARVPSLFSDIASGRFDPKGQPRVERKGMAENDALQVPVLFDFQNTDGPYVVRPRPH